MDMKKKFRITGFALLFIAIIVLTVNMALAAEPFRPRTNIDMQTYNITNATKICVGTANNVCITSATTFGSGTSNLTLAQVAASVGNWSASQSSYVNGTALGTLNTSLLANDSAQQTAINNLQNYNGTYQSSAGGWSNTSTFTSTNLSARIGNLTINETGIHYGNTKIIARSYDAVVCRGRNTGEDAELKAAGVTVCLSSATDCGALINTVNNRTNMSILLCGAQMPITTAITGRNGTHFIGMGRQATNLYSNGSNSAVFSMSNVADITIEHMTLEGNPSTTGTLLYADPTIPPQNIVVRDLNFKGKGLAKTMFSPRGSGWTVRDIYLDGTAANSTEFTDVMSMELINSAFDNIHISNCPGSCFTAGVWSNNTVRNLFLYNISTNIAGAAGVSIECGPVNNPDTFCQGAIFENIYVIGSPNNAIALQTWFVKDVFINRLVSQNLGGTGSTSLTAGIFIENGTAYISQVSINGTGANCIRGKNANLYVSDSELSSCNLTTNYPGVGSWSSGVEIDCTDTNCTGQIHNIRVTDTFNSVTLGYQNGYYPSYIITDVTTRNVVKNVSEENASSGVARVVQNSYVEPYQYTAYPACAGIFLDRSIHNATDAGTCIGGTWQTANYASVSAATAGNGWTNSSTTVRLANNNTNVSVGAYPVIFVDTANNRVGIGTPVPQSGLDVNNTIKVAQDINWSGAITHALIAENGPTTVLSYDSVGTVAMASFTGRSFSINSGASLNLNAAATTGNTVILGGSSGLVQMGKSGTIQTTLNTSTGNLGIGTTLPTAKLDVNGTTNMSGNVIMYGTLFMNTSFISTIMSGDQIKFQSNGAIISSTNGDMGFRSAFTSKTFNIRDSNSNTKVSVAFDTGNTWINGSLAVGKTGVANQLFEVNGTANITDVLYTGVTNHTGLVTVVQSYPQLRLCNSASTCQTMGVTVNGFLGFPSGTGINQLTPGGALGVGGSIAAGSFSAISPPTNGMIISGNVGIGTNNATQKFDVNGSANISGTTSKIYLPNMPGTGNNVCWNATDGSLFRNTTCP